jgi:hypothetical protein
VRGQGIVKEKGKSKKAKGTAGMATAMHGRAR